MLNQKQDADDLLQEVWLTVFRDLPRLKDPDAFPAWLYQIARHRAMRELRKRRQQVRSLDELDPPADDREEPSFSSEDAAKVHPALDQLAPEHREVLLLRFMEDMSYEDIARVTGHPLGTVRSRLHYAKQALKRVLERRNVHE
jgi:RNA polymerase sigma-70 factor (ECF subfamily)